MTPRLRTVTRRVGFGLGMAAALTTAFVLGVTAGSGSTPDRDAPVANGVLDDAASEIAGSSLKPVDRNALDAAAIKAMLAAAGDQWGSWVEDADSTGAYAGVGLWLRLNQPLLQTLNQVLGPLQLVMILGYVRLGEWLWRAQDDRFTIGEMLRTFREASLGGFLSRFGWAGVHAFTAWALTSPLLLASVYYLTRPALRRLASKSAGQA